MIKIEEIELLKAENIQLKLDAENRKVQALHVQFDELTKSIKERTGVEDFDFQTYKVNRDTGEAHKAVSDIPKDKSEKAKK